MECNGFEIENVAVVKHGGSSPDETLFQKLGVSCLSRNDVIKIKTYSILVVNVGTSLILFVETGGFVGRDV
jgi:hypothetical protein